jgi:hypothetical protein
MKLYRFWTKVQEAVTIDGNRQMLTTYGGSNLSLEEAVRAGREKLARVQRKINGEKDLFADYEAEIREEIIEELDPRNVVTRNRYGALVLNAERTLIIDIDEARYEFMDKLKGHIGGEWKKKKILEMIEQKAPGYRGLVFRVYETTNGFRVVVTGRDFDARAPEVANIMKDFNADALYAALCKKQNCFRARLTPKPYRIKCKGHKVVYPRDAAQEAALQAWVKDYDYLAQNFGVCKFIKAIGGEGRNAVVDYHDRATRAHESARLA